MNKLLIITITTGVLLSNSVWAKDEILKFEITPLLQSSKAKEVLYDVPLYFADQAYAKTDRKLKGMTTSQKTNAFNKSAQEACEWAFLSAIKVFQLKAQREGMDAVVNITSNYKHHEFSSTTEFECGSGNIIAGVALKADLVKFSN
ncbi:excinuclease ABC subunit A [Paraglaciecola hydrolytica]|uniref:Excinuclease ABC subunit A n=1 Tax=Paraglaciecola hydrolytica TaxID=1799789 RepID=A0A136A291_9ALTE|nr:excinuclease ABC subunit A [Paraglaciecola hydrolytica]KXI29341.1 excinuclease ABC subunit A [Paraglaciecola hydrolytica]